MPKQGQTERLLERVTGWLIQQALLDALVDRMGKEAEQTLLPIVQDPDLPALQISAAILRHPPVGKPIKRR